MGYNTHEWGGFLSYGHGYGLLQYDFVREYLLTLYSLMAHQYTRGTWTAPETRLLDPKRFAAPYCTPAQMTVPLLTRWMLVFEEPASDALWLAKGTPRSWLEDGNTIAVSNAPTRWGSLSFSLALTPPGRDRSRPGWFCRRPRRPPSSSFGFAFRQGHRIRSVTPNGKPWAQFNAEEETVTAAPGRKVDRVAI